MIENRPLSGRFIGIIQERYIRNRVKANTALKHSFSEPVLGHLRTEGAIRGIPFAFKEAEEICAKDLSGVERKLYTSYVLVFGAIEFILISGGIKARNIHESGHWKPLINLIAKVSPEAKSLIDEFDLHIDELKR